MDSSVLRTLSGSTVASEHNHSDCSFPIRIEINLLNDKNGGLYSNRGHECNKPTAMSCSDSADSKAP